MPSKSPKQGSGNRTRGDQKVEPKSTAINTRAVGQIGVAQTNRPDPLHAGRGYSAPAIRSTTSKSGSQGRH